MPLPPYPSSYTVCIKYGFGWRRQATPLGSTPITPLVRKTVQRFLLLAVPMPGGRYRHSMWGGEP